MIIWDLQIILYNSRPCRTRAASAPCWRPGPGRPRPAALQPRTRAAGLIIIIIIMIIIISSSSSSSSSCCLLVVFGDGLGSETRSALRSSNRKSSNWEVLKVPLPRVNLENAVWQFFYFSKLWSPKQTNKARVCNKALESPRTPFSHWPFTMDP